MSTLELCEKYFGTRDVYKLMNLTKDSLEKDVKKAYYRLSLQVHPDRVAEADKETATEKFKVLTKIHGVLSDPNKKAIYDEQGTIDDDGESDLSNWMQLWRQFFKPITTTDIENFQKSYTGSETEERDIRKAYLAGNGCINYMMDCVPFMTVEDEPRITEIVKKMIEAGDVPEYEQFLNEPKAKRNRRHKKYAKEAREAEAMKREMAAKSSGNGLSLEQQIMRRQSDREEASNNFLDRLLEKYGGPDDSEEFVPGKKATKIKSQSKKKAGGKESIKKTKGGRVTKKK